MIVVKMSDSEARKVSLWVESKGYADYVEYLEGEGLVVPENWVATILTLLGRKELSRTPHIVIPNVDVVTSCLVDATDADGAVLMQEELEHFGPEWISLIKMFWSELRKRGYKWLRVTSGSTIGDLDRATGSKVFRIVVGRNSSNDPTFRSSGSFYGMPFNDNEMLMFSSGAVPLFDECGNIGAELVDGTLFLLFPFLENKYPLWIKAVARTLETVLNLMGPDGEELPLNLPHHLHLAHEAKARAFVDVFRRSLARDLMLAQGGIEKVDEALNQLDSQIKTGRREIQEKSVMIQELLAQSGRVTGLLKGELENVLSIPEINSVVCSDVSIVAHTHELFARHSSHGTWHLIGEFAITLFPLKSKFTLNNKTGSVQLDGDKWDSPNAKSSGYKCLGGFDGKIQKAIREYRIFDALTMIIRYLTQININDDWGKRLNYWPQVEVELCNGLVVRKS